MEKSPDERPFLDVFKLRLASANSMATPYSGTEHPVDLRPVCKFKFVRCDPVEKNRALYLLWFNHCGLMKFGNTIFPMEEWRFFRFLTKFPILILELKTSSFCILAIYQYTDQKGNLRGGCPPPTLKSFENMFCKEMLSLTLDLIDLLSF